MELSTDYEHILAGGGEMGQRMRELDWATTPLGPISNWPQSLRTAVSICLASHFPMIIWWGPEFVKLYNDAYRPMLGTKHPQALGQRGKDCWPEIWDIIGPMLEGVLSCGEATWSENQFLPLERNGYAEECYFTFSYSPIRDESGGIGGVFTAVTETTGQVVSERHLSTLRALSSSMVEAQTAEEVGLRAVQTLSENPTDLPFALLYALTPDGTQAQLAALTSNPYTSYAAPALLPLADEKALWPLGTVTTTGQPVVVENLHLRLGDQAPLLSSELFLSAPHTALVLPMARAGEEHPTGFLITGLNPHRPLDEAYRGFLLLVAEQIATALDTTRAYQDAKARAQALTELDRAKTTFFSNISHEFRTPLALSLGPLEALLADTRQPLAEEHRTQVEMVRRNALRQLKLVNTLLDFARIEAGRAEATYLPTDLAQLTTDLTSAFRAAIEQAGLQLLVDCPPLPEPVFVDRDMWEKIVLNLLSNAFKFTFEGCIRVTLHPVEEVEIELVVQDSGVGIGEADLPHIFERFYQAHATQARTMEGSGIGLALVQELVRLHVGSLTVQSQEGVGTTFILRLPSGKDHLPAEHVGTTPVPTATALGADPYVEEVLRWLPEPLARANGATETLSDSFVSVSPLFASQTNEGSAARRTSRLLVVDDNADMRAYLKRLLSPLYQVLLAADGNTALELARGTRPDLLITDVMMPGLDGFALLKAIRATPAIASLPVILLSARAGEEAKLEGLQAGANDYLVKPFSTREVLVRVQARLEIARLRQETELARQHLHDLFMQAPAAICVLHGPQHVFELLNPLYQQLLGSQREILGKSVREALPELEGQGFYELLDQVYTTGEPFVGTELRAELARTPTGEREEAYFNFVYQPLCGAGGEVESIMVHAVEVTEQVQVRQRMQTFLGIASHELKNPLTSIKGNVNLARRRVSKALGEMAQEENVRDLLEGVSLLLTRADQQITFQNRLVSDLVDTTRIQVGKLELRTAPADLNTIVSEAVAEQRQLVPTRVIHVELVAEGMQLVSVDADRIGQVVTNYLSNALKYSERDREVSVQVEARDSELRVSVRDRGAGLDADEQEHIWERFYRAPGVQVKSGSGVGLGLGLYICRTIIEEHGGCVGVESVKGEGSTFWFTLPSRNVVEHSSLP